MSFITTEVKVAGVEVVERDFPAKLRLTSAFAIAAIAVFNLLDILTTHALLARGAIESNPLAALLLPGGKVELFKVVILGALGWRVMKRKPTVAFAAGLWFVAGFYFLTIVSNVLILSRVG